MRLLTADWFEENADDARAEFVRLQCQRSVDPVFEFGSDNLDRQASDTERELYRQHQRAWNVPLIRFLLSSPIRPLLATSRIRKLCEWYYRRGFVEALVIDPRVFIDHHETLLQLGPIEHLRVRRMTAPLSELIACPGLSRIRSLHLANHMLDQTVLEKLFGSPFLPELTHLFVNATWFANQDYASFCNLLFRSPHLPKLQFIRALANGEISPRLSHVGAR